MVIWVTGLSGSGKTTLCHALRDVLKDRFSGLVLLDGDRVRAAFGNDLGYGEADRKKQVRRIQQFAKSLSDQGIIVLAAVLYSHPELLAWNRKNFSEYFEIYMDVSMDDLRRRDDKGLYKRAFSGQMQDVVGVDIPWNAPAEPEWVIQNDFLKSPEALARGVLDRIPRFADLVKEVSGA